MSMVSASAEELSKNKHNECELTNEDVIISTYPYVENISNVKTGENMVYVEKIMPLYDTTGKISAYYVCYSTGTYAVVNNDSNNPFVIEFGEGKQPDIEKCLDSDDESERVIYSNPFSVINSAQYDKMSYDERQRYKKTNETIIDKAVDGKALKRAFEETKKTVLDRKLITQSRDLNYLYGFFASWDLPNYGYYQYTLPGAYYVDWADMSDYNYMADNHCGATTITNLALYFAYNGYGNLRVNNSTDDTFAAVYAIVGDGPVVYLDSYASQYFSNRGYYLNVEDNYYQDDFDFVWNRINAGKPCAMLVAAGFGDWHWILGVGTRQYSGTDSSYIQINNNWEGSINRYIDRYHTVIFSVSAYSVY